MASTQVEKEVRIPREYEVKKLGDLAPEEIARLTGGRIQFERGKAKGIVYDRWNAEIVLEREVPVGIRMRQNFNRGSERPDLLFSLACSVAVIGPDSNTGDKCITFVLPRVYSDEYDDRVNGVLKEFAIGVKISEQLGLIFFNKPLNYAGTEWEIKLGATHAENIYGYSLKPTV